MVTTRAAAKRNAQEAALDTPIKSIQHQLISLGVITAKKSPNERMLRLLYEKHVLKSKRVKLDFNEADVSMPESSDRDTERAQSPVPRKLL